MDLFLIKRFIAALLMPLPFCLLLGFLGLFLQWLTILQRLGRFFTTLAILLLLVFSFKPTADRLLAPLENRYPPLAASRLQAGAIDYIVVLGSGHTSDARLPATSQLNEEALARLTEGIRLHRLLPGTRLLLSGGAVFDPAANAVVMAEVARALGVPKDHLLLEIQSRNTEEEAELIKKMVGSRPFILVTSASHLPRAMVLFERLGMQPIPGPARFLVKEDPSSWSLFPGAGHLQKSESAIYEYLGLAWLRLHEEW